MTHPYSHCDVYLISYEKYVVVYTIIISSLHFTKGLESDVEKQMSGSQSQTLGKYCHYYYIRQSIYFTLQRHKK